MCYSLRPARSAVMTSTTSSPAATAPILYNLILQKSTGLMLNPSPTRRLPTFVAQPMVAQLWPLAAALAGTCVTWLPPPRKLAAELRSGGGMQLPLLQPHLDSSQRDQPGKLVKHAKPASRTGVFAGDPDAVPSSCCGGERLPMLGSPDHLCRSGCFAVYALWILATQLRLGTDESGNGAQIGESSFRFAAPIGPYGLKLCIASAMSISLSHQDHFITVIPDR